MTGGRLEPVRLAQTLQTEPVTLQLAPCQFYRSGLVRGERCEPRAGRTRFAWSDLASQPDGTWLARAIGVADKTLAEFAGGAIDYERGRHFFLERRCSVSASDCSLFGMGRGSVSCRRELTSADSAIRRCVSRRFETPVSKAETQGSATLRACPATRGDANSSNLCLRVRWPVSTAPLKCGTPRASGHDSEHDQHLGDEVN